MSHPFRTSSINAYGVSTSSGDAALIAFRPFANLGPAVRRLICLSRFAKPASPRLPDRNPKLGMNVGRGQVVPAVMIEPLERPTPGGNVIEDLTWGRLVDHCCQVTHALDREGPARWRPPPEYRQRAPFGPDLEDDPALAGDHALRL